MRLADELHETARLGDELWAELARCWSEEQLLELLLVAGFYHLVAFTVNALEMPPEPWAQRFPGAAATPSKEADSGGGSS